jgi:hypothetical protein
METALSAILHVVVFLLYFLFLGGFWLLAFGLVLVVLCLLGAPFIAWCDLSARGVAVPWIH